ncbi:MAG: molecular chaperone DnaK [Acidobacteria bacterium]|nr:MAG: molecular chaperone DnaK [Acidobacteriota bacterium]PYQ85797.1 MAG: molecular chaperone DnaK [Acidobacteriota bacterium]PYR05297.1 MAG: molecular chaperone DnaK [Acidobacteriota bacterium]
MSKVVGIDLGTTNSLVAYVKDGPPVVIRDNSGDGLVPSVVSIDEGGTVYVGREAERRLLTDAGHTAYSVKRFMGKGIEDVRDEARHFPFRIGGEAGGVIRIGLGSREFTPPEISAFVLRELKHRAEAFFAGQGVVDNEVDRAVITVPAYFNDAQRTATRDAGRIAGLEVLRIINEPTAASLAYGLDKRHTGIIAVYDLGGGTFDISILRVEDGVFQVLSTNGDTHLGGDDIDVLLMDRVGADLGRPTDAERPARAEPTHRAEQAPPLPSLERVQELRKAVIQAKCDLSDDEETVLNGKRFTRAEFEALIEPIVDRTLGPCRQALADAGLQPSQIDEVVLVGGSTRIPLVRRRVEELFGRKPHSELNPDEVVALGAAVQADILVTGNREMLLLDVTPLSLGIETMGGVTSKIIMRNSTIPATGSEIFTTAVDNQTAVDIHVAQGERELVQDNRSLARFKLRGIPPMPAGLPRVQVQFQIDANGILSVTARELRTDVEQTIEVKPSYGLTDDEVERMLLDSFEHAEADFEARLLIEAKNEAEAVMHATEKSLRAPDFAEIERAELAPGERQKIESVLAGLKMVLNGNDRETIQKWTRALNDTTQHLAEVMMNRSVHAALSGKNISDV